MKESRLNRRRVLARLGAAICAFGVPAQSGTQARTNPATHVRVAAASDLKFALAHIAAQYSVQTGQVVGLSFGSSGNFARQIAHGLPVDLFMSADESYVLGLAKVGLTRMPTNGAEATGIDSNQGARYATGRIALLIGPAAGIRLDTSLNGLKVDWMRVTKFALANPEHAPYGRAARQALVKLGLWEMVRAKLVLGENIAQATQFVTSGAAQAGLTALSLALAPEVARPGQYLALPADLHEPLHQRMVLLNSAGPAAEAFYAYLLTPAVRAILARYGFSNP